MLPSLVYLPHTVPCSLVSLPFPLLTASRHPCHSPLHLDLCDRASCYLHPSVPFFLKFRCLFLKDCFFCHSAAQIQFSSHISRPKSGLGFSLSPEQTCINPNTHNSFSHSLCPHLVSGGDGGKKWIHKWSTQFGGTFLHWNGLAPPIHPSKPCSQMLTAHLHETLPDFYLLQDIYRDFPGGSVVRTPHFHCSGHGFNPWLGN